MATIPLYDARGEVADVAIPFASPPQQSYAADLLPQINRIQDTVERASQDRATLEAKELDVQFRNRLNELGYSPNGYYSLQGKAAVDGAADYGAQVEKLQSDILGSASPQVARMLGPVLGQHLVDEKQRVFVYTRKEKESWADQVAAGRIASLSNDAALRWDDPRVANDAFEEISREIRDRGAAKGLPPEFIMEEIATKKSAIAQSIVQTATVESPESARSMFELYGDLIDAKSGDRARTEKAVDTADLVVYAEKEGQRIFATHDSIGDAMAEVAKIEDAEERGAVRTTVSSLFTMKKQYQDDESKKAVDRTWLAISQNPNFKISDIPIGVPGEKRGSMMRYLNNRATGKPTPTQWDAYIEWNDLSDEEMSAADPNDWRNRLSEKHWKEFSQDHGAAQEALRVKETKAAANKVPWAEVKAQMKLSVPAEMFVTAKSTEAKRQRAAMFTRWVRRQYDALPAATFDDMSTIIDRGLERMTLEKDYAFDEEYFRFEREPVPISPPAENPARTGLVVPQAARDKIISRYQATHPGAGDPSESVIQQVWADHLSGKP